MRKISLVVLAVCFAASPVRAEDQWGISVGLTPAWHTAAPSRQLFGADQIDMTGSEVRFGVVRGDLFEGDWGISYVDKSINEDSTLEIDSACPASSSTSSSRSRRGRSASSWAWWERSVSVGCAATLTSGWRQSKARFDRSSPRMSCSRRARAWCR